MSSSLLEDFEIFVAVSGLSTISWLLLEDA